MGLGLSMATVIALGSAARAGVPIDTTCDPADFHHTQNDDPSIVPGGIACVNGQPEGQYSADNTFARVYTNTDGDVDITCIEAGIEANSGAAGQVVTASVLFSPTVTPDVNTAVLQASVNQEIPGGFTHSRAAFTFPSPVLTPNGQNIIAQMSWDATTPGVDPVGAIFPGGNPFGQTGDIYIISQGCGIENYTEIVSLGFPVHAVIIDYYANVSIVDCWADIAGPDGPGHPDGNVDALDFLLLIAQWGTPCTGACEADITGPTPLVPDGNVDVLDFLLLIATWSTPGSCP